MRPRYDRDRASARVPHPSVAIPLLTVAVLAALAACGDSATAPGASGTAPEAREARAFTVAGVTYPTVAIQGVNTSLAIGKTESLHAKLATPTASWMGAYMNWSSSNTSVASISTADQGNQNGDVATVVGVANGTTTITATTQSGTSASITITVGSGGNAPQSSGGYHEPAGMQAQINTGSMSVAPSRVSGGRWTEGSTTFQNYSPNNMSGTGEWSGNLSAVPGGTGMRVTYSPSLVGGNSPVRFGANIANHGTGHMYLRWKFRLSPNWTLSQANGIKVMEPRTVNSTENHVVNLAAYNGLTNGTSMYSSFLLQFASGGGTAGFMVPGSLIGQADLVSYFTSSLANIGGSARGDWHQMELYAMPESPAGAGNGQLTLWVDGVQVFKTGGPGTPRGGMHFFLPGESEGWSFLMFDPTYGGDRASDHPPTSIYWDIDDLYLSTK
ncbi:MAG TPA: Ig-like domain-containing protein [Gemmatimonadaceae bacterium]|nr:Ig-like domain-containing protein [Gemmatimonadaceae bacterium]